MFPGDFRSWRKRFCVNSIDYFIFLCPCNVRRIPIRRLNIRECAVRIGGYIHTSGTCDKFYKFATRNVIIRRELIVAYSADNVFASQIINIRFGPVLISIFEIKNFCDVNIYSAAVDVVNGIATSPFSSTVTSEMRTGDTSAAFTA